MSRYAQLINNRHPELTNIFGFVDGVYFPIFHPLQLDLQNAYYNGRKSMCSVTNVVVFGAELYCGLVLTILDSIYWTEPQVVSTNREANIDKARILQ